MDLHGTWSHNEFQNTKYDYQEFKQIRFRHFAHHNIMAIRRLISNKIDMNDLSVFRACTISDDELVEKIELQTEFMFETGQLPERPVIANANCDFDLLVDELILRFNEYRNKFSNNTNKQ